MNKSKYRFKILMAKLDGKMKKIIDILNILNVSYEQLKTIDDTLIK